MNKETLPREFRTDITTLATNQWLRTYQSARVLHVFDRVCNLVAPDGTILSLATAEIGAGPNSLIIRPVKSHHSLDWHFSDMINSKSPISFSHSHLRVGPISIKLTSGRLWDPTPDWQGLHQNPLNGQYAQLHKTFSLMFPIKNSKVKSVDQLCFGILERESPGWDNLSVGLRENNAALCRRGAKYFAGKGIGLTPSGDDFLTGIIYSLWATREIEVAASLSGEIASTAAALTTTYSASMLKSAALGEAHISWHRLIDAIVINDKERIFQAATRILSSGHSSGADVMAGFMWAIEILYQPIYSLDGLS